MQRPVSETTGFPKSVYIGTFVAVVTVWLLIGLAPTLLFCRWEVRGTFGDMFGAANSLFGALAFAGVTLALLLQRKQMQWQEVDRSDTAGQLDRQLSTQAAIADALARQAAAMERVARLTAISGLIAEFERQAQAGSTTRRDEFSRRVEELRKQLIDLLNRSMEA